MTERQDEKSFGKEVYESFKEGLVEGVGDAIRWTPVLLILWWLVPKILSPISITFITNPK
jgi:hypothetical protein